ncbi:MAG: HBL/NHE enterotoxin family protein [Pseudomonadota bacterium]
MIPVLLVQSNATSKALKSTLSNHATQASIVQAHSLMIQQQPSIDLSSFKNLKPFQTDINNTISGAKQHATTYLNIILPAMIKQTTNMDGYFNVQNALGAALNPDEDAKKAVALIKIAQDKAQQYKTDATGLVQRLNTLRTNFSTDASNFTTYTGKLNAAVNGDNGLMKSIDGTLSSMDGDIAGAITGIALSGLTILAGGLMIAVGAIAELVTAGTSTALVVAGVGVAAAGVAGEVASSITLSNLLDEKGKLLAQKSSLTAEVNFALGLTSNFKMIAGSAKGAAAATQDMASAWTTLENHLGNLSSSLEQGKTTVDDVRRLFQAAAKGDVKNIQHDLSTIEQQLSGVRQDINTNKSPGVIIRESLPKKALQQAA